MKWNQEELSREDLLSGKRPGQPTAILDSAQAAQQAKADEIVFKQHQERRLDLAEVRTALAGKEGVAYWNSLEELCEDPAFTELMAKEFPSLPETTEGLDRRSFLKLMGASLAMAGLTACTRQPKELIVPYVRAPEEFIPGKSSYFATSMTLGGYAMGLLAESHMGRPTKLEGNELHPASLGATNAFAQASILGMYDPDRSQAVAHEGDPSTWQAFIDALGQQLASQDATQGAGLRILTETVTSASQAQLLTELLDKYPRAKWVQYEAINRDQAYQGAQIAFGEMVDTIYHFDRANVVLTVDADVLGEGPAHVRYARDFSTRRDVSGGSTDMNRLYVIESVPSITGASADHRLAMRSSDIERWMRALARAFGIDAPGPELSGAEQEWMSAIATDLREQGSKGVIVVGDRQPAVVHALAHAIHGVLGSAGDSLTYVEPVAARADVQTPALRELVEEMSDGSVELLVMLDTNPVLTVPGDIDFGDALQRVPFSAHLGLYKDETAALSSWHVPMAHYLEGWGDARAFDGTFSIIQPLIAPLYDGKTSQQILALLLGDTETTAHDLVRNYWREHGLRGNFDQDWRRALHDGLVADSAASAKRVQAQATFDAYEVPSSDLEVVITPDSAVWDGRFANNAWLQEMPRSLSKLTWDNVVMIAPATAESLSLTNGDEVTVTVAGRSVTGPVWVQPGHAQNSISVQLGYGRTQAGQVGSEVGFDAYTLRSSVAPWFAVGASVQSTGGRHRLATTQMHGRMEGLKDRKLVRVGSLAQFLQNPDFAHEGVHDPAEDETLYPPYDYSQGYQWGMTIDLNRCIGCNACLVACQSENNIPVVGKDNAGMGRAMHWIRIDRYFAGDMDDPQMHLQPLTCMHCELAPCEPVCPVGATVHSADGLNQMVYNRCVGTRYCANNCPYKVRRFNFYQYADETTPQLKLMRNPNVTVRTRGVMEKCTYCVQRISEARIKAERDHRTIQDKDLKTACQQVCPTQAIAFGDINNPESEVTKRKAHALNYALLGELNVRPRTTYLAKVNNTNARLAPDGTA